MKKRRGIPGPAVPGCVARKGSNKMAAGLNALGAARVEPKPRHSRKAGRRLAVVPSREFHPVQEIDNSRVRRVADPREIRTMLFYLAIGACVFVGVLAFSWQQFAIVKDGYEIADLKARRDGLIEDNKIDRKST